MIAEAVHKEVLLLTGSAFAWRQWYNKSKQPEADSPQEHLEELCAAGMLPVLLPELFKAAGNECCLRQMRPGFTFLQMQFGAHPFVLENSKAIDPHCFITCFCYN